MTSSRCSIGVAPFAHERRAHSAVSHSKLEASTRTSSLAAPGVAPITHLRLVPIARDLARDAAAAVVGRGVNYLQLFGPAGTPGFNNPIVRPNDGSWGVEPQFVSLVGARAAHRRPTLPTQILGPILRLGHRPRSKNKPPLDEEYGPGKAKCCLASCSNSASLLKDFCRADGAIAASR